MLFAQLCNAITSRARLCLCLLPFVVRLSHLYLYLHVQLFLHMYLHLYLYLLSMAAIDRHGTAPRSTARCPKPSIGLVNRIYLISDGINGIQDRWALAKALGALHAATAVFE